MTHIKMAIQASSFSSIDPEHVRCMHGAIFCVDDAGMIASVLRPSEEDYERRRDGLLREGKLRVLPESQVLLPGFVDLHIHAPQWPQSGTALDRPLEIWLGEYTFPLEAKYRDPEFAGRVYEDVVTTTLSHGTTTAMYFATVDREPSVTLAKICGRLGQRGLVGKVVMDDPAANPDFCRDESPAAAVRETEEFIRQVQEVQNDFPQKVYPVITPRFIPSCTDESLEGLGKLVEKYGVHVQTHCSESDWEHGFVQARHGMNDAQSLNRFGLLTSRTVLAHATFLSEEDVALLAEKKTSIAHSPLSNAYFASSVLPLHDFSAGGINIGLATDVSGGYSPSMYQAIRQAVISSRMLQEGVDPRRAYTDRGRTSAAITLNRAFYAATAAGGTALELPIGRLEPGYAFDAQIVDLSRGIPHYYPEKKEEDLFHKILLLSESSNIAEVWVQGRRVK